MHQHLVACNDEDCTEPHFEGEVHVDTPEEEHHEGELAAAVATHALDVVAELHRQEEETERTEAIAEALEAVVEAQTPAEEHEEEPEHIEEESPEEMEITQAPEEVEPPAEEEETKKDDHEEEHRDEPSGSGGGEEHRARPRFHRHRRGR